MKGLELANRCPILVVASRSSGLPATGEWHRMLLDHTLQSGVSYDHQREGLRGDIADAGGIDV